jgi:4-diphosphocytidyl-2-C-methyl-D-erythritol kinase
VKAVTVRAFAKINLTLRVLARSADGYHDLRTVFQSLALHDTLTFRRARGALRIACDDPACPTDRSNLVWRAAQALWRDAGHAGRPRDVAVAIVKRIPVQSGLGGGSSDAAATLRGLAALWRLELTRERLHAIAAGLGADVPFLLDGGTALGLDRGDRLFPLIDPPPAWLTLVIPAFGVSTRAAYGWFDQAAVAHSRQAGRPGRRSSTASGVGPPTWLPHSELRNDLEPAVARRHPEIGRLSHDLRRLGAAYAAMSGSGSAVFGLFESRAAAAAAARALRAAGRRTIVTRTLNRRRFRDRSRAVFDLPPKEAIVYT